MLLDVHGRLCAELLRHRAALRGRDLGDQHGRDRSRVVGVFITGWLVDRTGSYTAPFVMTAGISLAGAVFYLVFGSGRRQID